MNKDVFKEILLTAINSAIANGVSVETPIPFPAEWHLRTAIQRGREVLSLARKTLPSFPGKRQLHLSTSSQQLVLVYKPNELDLGLEENQLPLLGNIELALEGVESTSEEGRAILEALATLSTNGVLTSPIPLTKDSEAYFLKNHPDLMVLDGFLY